MNTNKLSPQQIHDAKQFYAFFDAIPEEKWCRDQLTDRNNKEIHCAIGHLSGNNGWNEETYKLQALFGDMYKDNCKNHIAMINNSGPNSPKQNILNKLKEIIEAQIGCCF